MTLRNVRLILFREVRDQLRDRRTLFMIFVLPVLLYPLLGISLSQMKQFRSERPTRVLLIGAEGLFDNSPLPSGEGPGVRAADEARHSPERLADEPVPPPSAVRPPPSFPPPPLFTDGRLAPGLCPEWDQASALLELVPLEPRPDAPDAEALREEARRAIEAGQYDAALCFPADFAERLEAHGRELRRRAEAPRGGPRAGSEEPPPVPRPGILYTTANERSQIAMAHLTAVLDRWTGQVRRQNLEASEVPASAVHPFEVDVFDLARETAYRGAWLWSTILPMLLVVWAMTGAFYPAVDLCAGEKERGTLETLLTSPAARSEIVLGKLLTVMAFSAATAVLNLLSVGVTGCLIFSRLQNFQPPPPLAIVWLLVALLPVSALFSALCVALAAFARSSKEGQYYLVPLLLVSVPLAVVPMTSGATLSLGTALIPVVGIVLALKGAIEGSLVQVLPLLPVVLAVTAAACWAAVRWAVEQFNSESVMFRESERLDVGLWFRRLLYDRRPTPTAAAAVFCCVAILMLCFVADATLPEPAGFFGFVRALLAKQLACILAPALLMAIFLTSKPRQTLLLKLPRWQTLLAAAALAVAVQPVAMALRSGVERLYPVNEQVQRAMERMQSMFVGASAGWTILFMALLPAICEELAFRGFILSGFRQAGHRWRAIVTSAIVFGLVHPVVQQSILACLLGILLGYLAVQSGSILPGMLFHCLYNTLILASSWVTAQTLDRWCPWYVSVLGGLAGAVILAWFARLPSARSPEEALHAAIRAAPAGPAGCCADGVE
jgi:sodium transport system permease protein